MTHAPRLTQAHPIVINPVMGIFSFLFGNKPPVSGSPPPILAPESPLTSSDRADHLGRAAAAKHRGKQAIANADYNGAWRCFHEQKEHCLRHAKRYGMTARQTLALDASVHEDLSNVLRLEGKHDDALVHLIYCVVSSPRPTKVQSKKVSTYFSRCGFKNVSPDELATLLAMPRELPDLLFVQARVRAWRAQG